MHTIGRKRLTMEPSLDEMEFYIRMAGWTFVEGRWESPEKFHALTVDYAYMSQRWWDGFKDILVNKRDR
jgi:hypothetical protein